jgi:hypothetical protein
VHVNSHAMADASGISNDFGGVGMQVPDRIKLYRAQQLRSVGGNGRWGWPLPLRPGPGRAHVLALSCAG